MIIWKFIKYRVYAVAAGTSLLFIGLLLVYSKYDMLMKSAIQALYDYDYELGKDVLQPWTIMPRIDDLLQQAGILPWMFIAFLIACILPVFFILRDYYDTKSMRTIMRLPISKTYYYVDKLLPPALLLGLFWLMLWIAITQAECSYMRSVPAEKIPADVREALWANPPARLFHPFADLSHMPAALSFLILAPATVILFILAVRSKRRGILSGVIACGGILAVFLYLLDLPASPWLVPTITAGIVAAGIWHINRIQIT